MKNSIGVKMIIIGILTLVLLIPTAMISGLVNERQNTRDNAIDEASSKWSKDQLIVGPIMQVPYKTVDNVEGKVIEGISYAYFTPEKLDINSVVSPEILERGIYKIAAYKSDISFSGRFNQPNFNDLNIKPENILWNKAGVFVGISDSRGIKDNIQLSWNGKKYQFFSGSANLKLLGGQMIIDNMSKQAATIDASSGVIAQVPLTSVGGVTTYEYSFSVKLNGSKTLYFSPVASETNVAMKSGWATPGFDGAFLPDERVVDKDGFQAKWKVLELNRNIPKSWTDKDSIVGTSGYTFGTKFLIGVDEYQKNMRVIKYAILTIALTFLIFFFVEVINKIKIHPFQYVLVGLALCLFYSLLLSISEFVNFNFAYLISTILTISAVTLYSITIFKNKMLSLIQAGILIIIYAFIFSILQLQDYALLVGNLGLFLTLSIVMYLSRKVDWYELGQRKVE